MNEREQFLRNFVALILHGDAAHQQWLRSFMQTYINFSGQIPLDILKRLQAEVQA